MEWLDYLDENGEAIGRATREECHGGSFLLHPVVHVLVYNRSGMLLLQKRSESKDIQPGRWDTSVGGHLHSGETVEEALHRETGEELGIHGPEFEKLYTYILESDIERERVTTFRCTWDGPVCFQAEEIDEVRFFTPVEIESLLGSGFFTPNFEEEWRRYRKITKMG
jgi:isopentenyldiphosphate isomerase